MNETFEYIRIRMERPNIRHKERPSRIDHGRRKHHSMKI